MQLETADTRQLRPHPEHDNLFEPMDRFEFGRLKEHMSAGGRFQPLLITDNNFIIAGVEHWQAARELGWLDISIIRAPRMRPSDMRALMITENIRHLEVREHHLWRGMNNFFDMEPLRPPGGW